MLYRVHLAIFWIWTRSDTLIAHAQLLYDHDHNDHAGHACYFIDIHGSFNNIHGSHNIRGSYIDIIGLYFVSFSLILSSRVH
jgi:hypothetical protein